MTDQDIRIEIKAESSKASAEIKKLNKDIARLNKQITGGGKANVAQVNQMTRSFKSLTAHVAKLATIYAGFHTLIGAITTTANFEQAIKRLGVVSGATAEELSALEETALGLGESTVFSASQVASGLNEMALGGLAASEQMAGIEDVLNLAAVGLISLEEATNITVTAMKSFGLEAEDMNDITDIIAKGSTNSATTITQLGNALSKVGTVAKAYNVSLEETVAALGVLADAGRRGAEAGTQLKIVMSRLAGNKEAKKYIDELGISIYDTTTGKILPFITQLENVKKALEDLSDADAAIKLSEIFGEEGKASAIALMEHIDLLKDKLGELKEAMADDFAATAAKEMMDTLIGSYKNLMSALEGLAIEIGKTLIPVLREMMDGLTEAIRSMDEDKVKMFAEGLGGLIEAVATLGEIFLTLGVAVGTVMHYFPTLTKYVMSLTVAFIALQRAGILTITTMKGVGTVVALSTTALRGFFTTLGAFAMVHPYIAVLVALGAAFSAYTDHVERGRKEEEKYAAELKKKVFTLTELSKEVMKYFDSETKGFILSTKARDEYLTKLSTHLGLLEQEGELVQEAGESSEQYALRQKIVSQEKEKLNKLLIMVAESLNADTLATGENGQAWLRNRVIVLGTTEAYSKLSKAYPSITESHKEYILGIIEREEKLKDKIQNLIEEKLRILKDYANKRQNIEDKYEDLEYKMQQKGLSDFKKYQQDKLKIIELNKKAEEALKNGDYERAKKYYAQMEQMATSFGNTEIKIDKNTSIAKAQTQAEALRIYKATKAGEIEALMAQKVAELEAHQLKLELAEIELEIHKRSLVMMQRELELKKQMASPSNKILYQKDIDAINTVIESIDELESKMGEKKLKVKVELDKLEAEKEANKLEGDLSNLKGNVIITTDTKSVKAAKEKIEKEPIVAKSTIDPTGMFHMFDATGKAISQKTVTAKSSIDPTGMFLKFDATGKAIESKKVTPKSSLDTTGIDIDVSNAQRLTEMKEFSVRSTMRMEGIKKSLEEAKSRADSTTLEPTAKVNTQPAETDLETLKSTASSTVLEPTAEVNTQPVEQGLKALEGTAKGTKLEPKVDPDLSIIGKKLKETEDKLKNKKIKVGITAETKDLTIEVDKAIQEVDGKSAEITVGANTESGLAEANGLMADIEAIMAMMGVGGDTSVARSDVSAVLAWINSQVAYVHVYEVYHPAHAGGGLVQKLADGGSFSGSGRVAGYDPTDSDKVSAMLTGGEFVTKREATDYYGLDMLNAINSMVFPKPQGYAEGGAIKSTSSRNIALNFMDDDGAAMGTMTDEETAQRIENYFRKYAQ